jgi:hypothetical protein
MAPSYLDLMRRPLNKLRHRTRGQAMLEYSAINATLLIFLCTLMVSNVFPGRKNLLEVFLDAYQVYYDSYYFVLNLPFP